MPFNVYIILKLKSDFIDTLYSYGSNHINLFLAFVFYIFIFLAYFFT